ncbi:hypothetical protein M436DRAFT_86371 [Aureobasidium namibiae CBS 147.97]|uniref:Uncharacterized protein n=1 Tax=Aureobasidium namibiae CBS 147.97 TaxID=1043004 RepID=A0A074W6F7_9PEZI
MSASLPAPQGAMAPQQTQDHIGQNNTAPEQSSLLDAQLEIEELDAENQFLREDLAQRNRMVVALNEEIMRQDTAIIDLKKKVKGKDAMTQRRNKIMDELREDILTERDKIKDLERKGRKEEDHVAALKFVE